MLVILEITLSEVIFIFPIVSAANIRSRYLSLKVFNRLISTLVDQINNLLAAIDIHIKLSCLTTV